MPTDYATDEIIPVFAVSNWLRNQSAVTAVVGASGGLPNIYEKAFPIRFEKIERIPKSILVRHSNPGTRFEESPLIDAELDVFCYGPDPLQARQVYTVTANALRGMVNEVLSPAPNRCIQIKIGVGADLTDPGTGWDFVLFSARVVMTNVASS